MRINFFGGPSSGKSTTAAWLFSELKVRGESVEHVNEYVKRWAYEQRPVGQWDQIYFLGKQMQYEYQFLKYVEKVVTDSPVLLSMIYAKINNPTSPKVADSMRTIIEEYEKCFPSLNIYLKRDDKPYDEAGRWQNKDEAIALDKMIRDELDYLELDYVEISWDDRETILQTVLNHIESKKDV